MLSKVFPPAVQFALLAALGFVVLFLAPVTLRDSCPPEVPKSRAVERDGHPQGEQRAADQTPNSPEWIGKAEQQQPDRQNERSANSGDRNWVPQWLCGDVKATDWALIFFTYCLVLVGWFTMRSNENVLRDIERAHLFAGPYHGQITVADNKIAIPIAVDNNGRTTGFLKEFYGEFSATEPTGKVVYDRRKGRSVPFDSGVAPGPAHGSLAIKPFESDIITPHFFFGYVRYLDTFRRPPHQ